MFHHFHSNKFIKSQGSISKDEFENLLNYLKDKFNLIGANEYVYKINKDKLRSK